MIVVSSKVFSLTKSFFLISACPVQRARAGQPLLGSSLTVTYEDFLSSLHRAAAHVGSPTGETEAESHHCQRMLCEKRASALSSCSFPLSPSCPTCPQWCSLLLCPVSIIRTQKNNCTQVGGDGTRDCLKGDPAKTARLQLQDFLSDFFNLASFVFTVFPY